MSFTMHKRASPPFCARSVLLLPPLLLLLLLVGSFSPSYVSASPSARASHATTRDAGALNATASRQNFPGYPCVGTRVRRDIRDLPAAERADWQAAIVELANEPWKNGLSRWDRMAKMHNRFTSTGHGGAYFLPWHRLFLVRLEDTIRSRGRPNFALPFWNWSVDATDPALSAVWAPDFAGDTHRRNGIVSGPFATLPISFPKVHFIKRRFYSQLSGSMGAFFQQSDIRDALDSPNFGTFSDALEMIHNEPHNRIRGDMGVLKRAANDPVFYLHHAYIDAVWAQRQNEQSLDEFGGTHDFGGTSNQQPAVPSHYFRWLKATASSSFNMGCDVQYVPYSGSYVAPVDSPTPSPTPSPIIIPTPTTTPTPSPAVAVILTRVNDDADDGTTTTARSEADDGGEEEYTMNLDHICDSRFHRMGMTKTRCLDGMQALIDARAERA